MALESLTKPIEETLRDLLSSQRFPLGRLAEAARYTALSGGKFFRPQLVMATAELYNVPLKHTLYPACALELIHTYSLIHDDLPCMDNDDFRRGQPSLHKAYNEGHALLTGDFLLTYAFEVLSHSPHISSDQKLSLINTLSKRAGALGMIGGQELDLASASQDISLETLFSIHQKKTAALITAALEFGGILGASPHMATLTLIGEKIGLAFQIFDDLKDSDDLDKARASVMAFMSPEKAQAYADELIQSALNHLQSINCSTNSLQDLLKNIHN